METLISSVPKRPMSLVPSSSPITIKLIATREVSVSLTSMISFRTLDSTRKVCARRFLQKQQQRHQHQRSQRKHLAKATSTIAAAGYQRFHLVHQKLYPQQQQQQHFRCFSSSESNSAAHPVPEATHTRSKERSYLERWAGISGLSSSSSDRRLPQATPSMPAPSTTTAPLVTFFGRTYLLSTFKIPPLPRAQNASGGNPINGDSYSGRVSGNRQKITAAEEEQRAFEWIREALIEKGAIGGTGFSPGAGSPVVLDLGAVSQDGSPHGRPASRASLAGVVRAVKAAGLVPIGACNASHDVLKAAHEEGLPEVMMVQSRPRGSPAGATVQTRAWRRSPERSLEETSSKERSPNLGNAANCHPASAPEMTATDLLNRTQTPSSDDSVNFTAPVRDRVHESGDVEVVPSTPERPSEPAESIATAPHEAVTRVEEEAPVPTTAVDVGLDEAARGSTAGSEEEGEEERETMIYRGSVRSGQQVYAEGTSLVVMGTVSSGGEVMADGDIHVYGTLRGRALAGLSGNKAAKIFSTRFDAELVGVGDVFTTCHDPDSLSGLVIGAPTTVGLEEGSRLAFRSFELSPQAA